VTNRFSLFAEFLRPQVISRDDYFRLLETSLNVFWSCVPRTVIETIIATAISEAIRAYSIAGGLSR